MVIDVTQAANINFKVFGLTGTDVPFHIYRTRGEQANHYITEQQQNPLTFMFTVIHST